MKTKLMIMTLAMASTVSVVSMARESRDYIDRTPQLTAVKWMGNFRCDEKIHDPNHMKDHQCDLKFVNDETGEEWNVKDNPVLQSIHRKQDGVVKAHVEAMKSPRYLLGGSYIEIQKIEALPQGHIGADLKAEPGTKITHVCSLSPQNN